MGKNIFKILGGIIIGLAVIVYFSYDYWLEKELKYQLSEIISKDPNSLYKYNFKKLDINLVDGSVKLKGISIEPRDRAYDSLALKTNTLNFLFSIKMEEISLDGFEITKFLKTKAITVKALTISKPFFTYVFHWGKKGSAESLPLGNLFSDKFISAELGELLIEEGQLVVDDYSDSDPPLFIHNLNFKLTKARIDSATVKRFSPFDYEEISLSAANIELDIAEDFSIVSDSLLFDAASESLLLKNFQLKPRYSQENFAKKYVVQKQWFAITLKSLAITNINIDKFVEVGKINIGRVNINKPNVALYKDKSKPPPPFIRKLLPASMIKKIPVELTIDSIALSNGYIAINETSDLTGNDSNLSFYDMNALVTNFTNDPISLQKSAILELNATTKISNVAATKVNMKFNLLSEIDEFTSTGTVGSVLGETFNSVLEPMMAVKVTAGRINHINFSFTAMDTMSIGTVDADYEGIKLEVLNTDTTNTKSKSGFMTFAANTVIKTNNSILRPNYIQGVINTKRVQEKDIWPYLWHSIQTGLISTLAPITNDKVAKQQQKQHRKDLRKEQKSEK